MENHNEHYNPFISYKLEQERSIGGPGPWTVGLGRALLLLGFKHPLSHCKGVVSMNITTTGFRLWRTCSGSHLCASSCIEIPVGLQPWKQSPKSRSGPAAAALDPRQQSPGTGWRCTQLCSASSALQVFQSQPFLFRSWLCHSPGAQPQATCLFLLWSWLCLRGSLWV